MIVYYYVKGEIWWKTCEKSNQCEMR